LRRSSAWLSRAMSRTPLPCNRAAGTFSNLTKHRNISCLARFVDRLAVASKTFRCDGGLYLHVSGDRNPPNRVKDGNSRCRGRWDRLATGGGQILARSAGAGTCVGFTRPKLKRARLITSQCHNTIRVAHNDHLRMCRPILGKFLVAVGGASARLNRRMSALRLPP
jgi:hypothetical protein